MMKIDGEETLELKGFVMDNGEVLISDSDFIGDWKPTVVHITPSMIKFLIEQNERALEKLIGITIFPAMEG